MIGLIGRLSARLSRLSTAARLAWLNGVLGVVLLLSLAIAATLDGATSLYAVLVAFAVCTTASNAALLISLMGHGTPNGVSSALAGTLVGMFPPLMIGCALHLRGGSLAQAGVLNWILAFYLTALIVKTLLVAPVATVAAHSPTSTTSKAGT